MVKTEYICDVCGHTQIKSDQMLTMTISVAYVGHEGYPTCSKSQLWCRVCVEKVGLLPALSIPKEEAKEPTLEELVRRLVREEVTQ